MGTPCIVIAQEAFNVALFWTADGISTEQPSDGGDK
jgi:hypothetical protein